MGLFGFGNKTSNVVDLAERYRQKKDLEEASEAEAKSGQGVKNPSDFSDTDTTEERKRKLAKRIVDMATKIDDLSNQIYHLQQRIELLERKASIGSNS